MIHQKKFVVAIISLILLSGAGLALWLIAINEDADSSMTAKDSETQLSTAASISSGDTVVVDIYADDMKEVYGYQFTINYDKSSLEFTNRISSSVDVIPTIFTADKGDYLLVGATMIGDQQGFSGRAVAVCHLEFTALKAIDPTQIKISGVNVVAEDLTYHEDVSGWTVSVSKK